MASKTKYSNTKITAEKALEIVEKHADHLEKVVIASQVRTGKVHRVTFEIKDPDSGTCYGLISVNDKIFKINPYDPEKDFHPRFPFSGERAFAKLSGIVEKHILDGVTKLVEKEGDDGKPVKVPCLVNSKLKKYTYLEGEKKVPVKIMGGIDKIFWKYQSEVTGDEKVEDFEGIYRADIGFDKDTGLPYRTILNAMTARRPKGKTTVTMDPLQMIPDDDAKDKTPKPVSKYNISELLPSGSNVKGVGKFQLCVSSMGGSVKFDWLGTIYVEPAEKVHSVERDFEEDELEEMLAKAEARRTKDDPEPEDEQGESDDDDAGAGNVDDDDESD